MTPASAAILTLLVFMGIGCIIVCVYILLRVLATLFLERNTLIQKVLLLWLTILSLIGILASSELIYAVLNTADQV